MLPAAVAVTESEADVMGAPGVGCGLPVCGGVVVTVFGDDEPQPGKRDEAANASAPWRTCLRVSELAGGAKRLAKRKV
ncbi:hypothetical protein SBA5_110052 [Candidatus Sulfotelmatomonas gaucii]|uniref:Uncharacterized protein n=1 Tax=Candidatus Sulfuritelmatomonas gaucii TaxID=2043161 RepID=A0A2N9L303_9BACT|nr:hypothetical protein SBA5_110052 [Candidatus Sulfotelmatomonas gaucii]